MNFFRQKPYYRMEGVNMPDGQWQTGVLVGLTIGLIAVQAMLAYRMYRLRNRDAEPATGTVEDRSDVIDTEADIVECPECGSENELGYRYCRLCVTELPGTIDFDRATDQFPGRFTN